MHAYAKLAGFVLIAVGIAYVLKPDLFKRGIWTKTDIAQPTLSAPGYLRYMRGVGVFHIVLSVAVLAWAFLSH